ncbi:MAG: hypothetical protein RLZZ535_3177 [Cyanobacteriota bacterium]
MILFDRKDDRDWIPRLKAKIAERAERKAPIQKQDRDRHEARRRRDELAKKTKIERYLTGYCSHSSSNARLFE